MASLDTCCMSSTGKSGGIFLLSLGKIVPYFILFCPGRTVREQRLSQVGRGALAQETGKFTTPELKAVKLHSCLPTGS